MGKKMKIAVVGCSHGEFEEIYKTIASIEKEENIKVELLLCCGDVQATRNQNDLACMASKYPDMCSFYKYYSGELSAPILTILIGGNHEASNYLQELPFGGWIAPNMYYLGYAGVVNYKGIRIGGISGIHKEYNYYRGHFEYSPYNDNSMRSVYHYRQQDVTRLKQISEPIDIMMSHDWPNEVANYGNAEDLCQRKPHFRIQIDENVLGSPPCLELLRQLKPSYWFSGHLHCKFEAVIPHQDGKDTKFMSGGKWQPDPTHSFVQFVEVNKKNPSQELEYDLEWLTILHVTKHSMSVNPYPSRMSDMRHLHIRSNFVPSSNEIFNRFHKNLVIPKNFEVTAEVYNPSEPNLQPQQPKPTLNPQTTLLCNLLDIDDPLSLVLRARGKTFEIFRMNSTENLKSQETNAVDNKSKNATDAVPTPIKRVSLLASALERALLDCDR